MTIGFVINPAAGHGRGRQRWAQVERRLREEGLSFHPYFSTAPEKVTALACRAAAECETVVAVGGDGTLHQVLNGITGTAARLGFVPVGTGNDFCRSAGIPLDPVEAALALYRPAVRWIDCGFLGEEAFINVAGLGFDAAVCVSLERHWRWFPGRFGYVAAVLENLVRLRPYRVTIKLDGKVLDREVLLVAVANGRCFGGSMIIAPEARLDDGLLEVVIIGGLGRLEFLRFFPLVYQGKHVGHPAVEVLQARQVEITVMPPLQIQADGEAMGYTPAVFRVEPCAVPLVVPNKCLDAG